MRTETVMRTVYIAQDDKRFDTELECMDYEMRLERKNNFKALKAKVDAIECIEDSSAPFGYSYVDDERYEYRWYRPKNYAEVMALNSFFNIAVEQGESSVADVIGEWVGVEIDGGYDGYSGKEDTYDMPKIAHMNERLEKFYAALGYAVKVQKLDSAVKVRDEALKDLWKQFEDIPINPETECIEEPYLHFPIGTSREKIWHWFDIRYSKGINALLYGDEKENSEGR